MKPCESNGNWSIKNNSKSVFNVGENPNQLLI